MSDDAVTVAGWAQHLIRLARLVRAEGDVQMVELSDDGVTHTYPLSDQLSIVAMNLDYDAVMAMPDEPGPDDPPAPVVPSDGSGQR